MVDNQQAALYLDFVAKGIARLVGIGGGGRCPLSQLFDENVRLNLLVIYVHVRTHSQHVTAPSLYQKISGRRMFTRDFVLHSTTSWRELPRGLMVVIPCIPNLQSIICQNSLYLVRMLLH